MPNADTPEQFEFDVFVSYSRQDQAMVLDLAQRLRDAGVRVWLDLWEIQIGDSIPAKIEYGLEHSRLLLLCISQHALGADWVPLESQSFRFRDPLNQARRMIPVRLDDAKVRGSLAQFRALDWRGKATTTFAQLCELLVQAASVPTAEKLFLNKPLQSLPHGKILFSPAPNAAFSPDGRLLLRGGKDGMLEL